MALDRTACLASGGIEENHFKKISGQGHKSGVCLMQTLTIYLIMKLQGLMTSRVFVTESIWKHLAPIFTCMSRYVDIYTQLSHVCLDI